jgi:riboflavin kinase/FMN adenylyltransferase
VSTKYAIALGMFDGVHMGHKAVLSGAVNSPFKSVAVTFSSIPFKTGGSIMTTADKERKLRDFGIDEVLMLDFFEIKDLSPAEFLELLGKKYNIGKICCGFNYRFGKKAAGDTEFLSAWCSEREIEFFECPAVTFEGETVSSTYIKSLIAEGKTELASKLLGEDFYFTAEVVGGDKRGRTFGFPTANQLYPENIVKPKNGVYQTVVTIDGKNFDGVTNIGLRPTYITDYISAETFILDYSSDCYGKEVKTALVKYLRDEKKFDSKEELISAINENAEYVKKHSRV